MKNKYVDLATYLSETGDTTILSDLMQKVGKCLILNCGVKHSYFRSYYLPKLQIKEIDLEKGQVVTQVIALRTLSVEKEYSGEEYTKFGFELTDIIKRYKLNISKVSKQIKIGTTVVPLGDSKWAWSDFPTEPQTVCTYSRNYYD